MLAYNNTNSDYNKVRIFYSLASWYLLQLIFPPNKLRKEMGLMRLTNKLIDAWSKYLLL